MNRCRKEQLELWLAAPEPYDIRASEGVRPKTLFARNLLPPIPGKNATVGTVSHFNRTAKDLFLAQAIACDRCGELFTPDRFEDFSEHIKRQSCDRPASSPEVSAAIEARGAENYVSIESREKETARRRVWEDGSNRPLPAMTETQQQQQQQQKRLIADFSGLTRRAVEGEERASESIHQMTREIERLRQDNAIKEIQQRAQSAQRELELKSARKENDAMRREVEDLRQRCTEQDERLVAERTAQCLERRDTARALEEALAQAADAARSEEALQVHVAELRARAAATGEQAARDAERIDGQLAILSTMDSVVKKAIISKHQLKQEQRARCNQEAEMLKVTVEKKKDQTAYEAQLIQLQTQLKGSKADAQKAAVKVGALEMELHEARKTIDAVEANCADTLRTESGLSSKLNEANERALRATNALSVQRNEHKRAIAALKARQEDEMARLRRKFEKCIADQAQQQLKKEAAALASVKAESAKELAKAERACTILKIQATGAERVGREATQEVARALKAAADAEKKVKIMEDEAVSTKLARIERSAEEEEKIHREEVKAYAHRREDMERTLQTIERRIQASHITEQRLQGAIDGAQRKLLNSRDELKHLEAQREELRASEEMVAEQRNAANSSIEKFSRILSESVDGANVSNLAEIGGLMEQVVEVAVHAARREPTIMQEDSAKSKTKTQIAGRCRE